MSPTSTEWTSAARDRIRDVQDSLIQMSGWARDANASAADTERLLTPYRELLETLYEKDLSLARLVDDSDLLLHAHGPAASGPSPRVSVLARLLTFTRDEVTRLAKQIAGISTIRVPASLDMAFAGVAGGSLFVGFKVASSTEAKLTQDAIKTIARACQLVSENVSVRDIAIAIEDPAERDMALAAVRHLSPSGHLGISEIEILGTQVKEPTSLTTDTRRHARAIMAQPASEAEHVTFVGTVRELDLDANRFEIRNVEGQVEDVRCAHELGEIEAKALVDKRVRVRGVPEYGARKVVRLLWVDEVELLDT
jgi:hypothetical protein